MKIDNLEESFQFVKEYYINTTQNILQDPLSEIKIKNNFFKNNLDEIFEILKDTESVYSISNNDI